MNIVMNFSFGFHEMLRISGVPEQLLTSQERLKSMEVADRETVSTQIDTIK
jgi:hypothetical protein